MCGIAGVFNFNLEPVSREVLLAMARSLAHRGPDDEGIYINGNIGLGHRRLSIIDLSERGHQPMSNEDGSIWIVFNGEVYNHLSLRVDLQKKGHIYKSQTDTESIIHLYEEKGFNCLDYLDGEFVFSIWDARKKIIFSARDRLGVKPFYYYFDDKYFIFASEIKAILSHLQVKKEVDLQGLSHYLSFSVSPAPLTCFKDIFKLEAGYFLIATQDGKITKKQYWDAIPKEKINCPQEEVIDAVRFKLNASIKKRLMSDVPFGVFLSGGVDSSANVALMSKMLSGPVKAFNVDIQGRDSYDESYFARLVSTRFKAEYQSLRINFDDFSKTFEDFAYYCDEPLCDYACVPNFYLAKLARQKQVPVIQIGEGNDEIFCGYRSYVAALGLSKFFSPLPGMVKGQVFNLLKLAQGEKLHYSIEQAAKGGEVFLGTGYLFSESEKRSLFSKTIDLSLLASSIDHVGNIYSHFLSKFPGASNLDKMIYLDLKIRLAELLLMRADKMTMAHSVEARVPFLDYQFVEYALSLPDGYKYHNNIGKYIFKKAMAGILPREVIYQPKKGFAGSPLNMLHRDFQEYLSGLYQDTEPLLAEYFDLRCIKSVLSFDGKAGNFRQGTKLWSIFTLMLWLRRFFK